ncbi:MAG: hypothetical protein ACT4OV_10385 [Microthrixaceae bacterium]
MVASTSSRALAKVSVVDDHRSFAYAALSAARLDVVRDLRTHDG